MPQRPPVNGHGRGFLAPESENQKEEQTRPQNGHVSASLWCKICHQAAVSLPSVHHVAAPPLHRICPLAFLHTSPDLSYPTPHPPRDIWGTEDPAHRGKWPQWTKALLISHFLPGLAQSLPLSVPPLPRGRQRQATTAVTSSAHSSVLVHCLGHMSISEPSCSG